MTTPQPTAAGEPSELLPCPFCGAGDTQFQENGRIWQGMKYSEPISVSVRHWCPGLVGQPSRMIERVGRDKPSAIEAWNRRAALTPAPAQPEPSDEFERGRQQGMKQERALWQLAAEGQKIEAELSGNSGTLPEPLPAGVEPVFELGHGWLRDPTGLPRGTKLYITPPTLTDAQCDAILAAVDLALHFRSETVDEIRALIRAAAGGA